MPKILDKIFGTDVVKDVGNAIDQNVTNDEERMELLKKWDEIQANVNIEEIKQYGLINRWRTAIGWVGAVSLAFYFIPQFVMASWMWVKLIMAKGELIPYPVTADGLLELVFALLGVAGLKTYEKQKGLRGK